MAYSDEDRRYPAKVSRVGIPAATVYALVYGALHFFLIPSKYADGFVLKSLFFGTHNMFPEIAVAAAGLLALLICGILSLTVKDRPHVVDKGWIIGGKAVLLAAPVGYIQSLCGITHYLTYVSNNMDFLSSFAVLATVFVGYALGSRGISVDHGFLRTDRKTYVRRVLRSTAVVLGVMLLSVLVLLGRQWMLYGDVLKGSAGLVTLVKLPLQASAPVALAVILVYPLLSVAARWNACSHGKLLGKGTALLGWVTLGVVALHQALSVGVMVITAGRLISDLLIDAYSQVSKLQAVGQITSPLAAALGIWTLCRLLPALRGSKPALWGARGLLGVVVLRQLSLRILDVIGSIYQLKRQSGGGVGIIGGSDFIVTYFTARAQSWLSMIFTVLSLAALVLLTIGLTRHLRVSKAFWAVPVLTAASMAASLLVGVIWELILRIADDPAAILMTVVSVVITAIITLIRSLVGILTLTRTPAEAVTPPPAPAEGTEPPKPRVEDYLYQL